MVQNVITKSLLSLVLTATFLAMSSSVSASRLHADDRDATASSHKSLARRLAGDLDILGGDLDSFFTDARWTFYDAGLGACGKVNDDSDFIVALNAPQFGPGYPGPHCFKTITMEYNGKKATATIMDMCPECQYGALDLSRSLFRFFAPEDIGVIYGQWYFGDDTDDDHDPPTPPKTKPKPKSNPPPPPPPPTPPTQPKVHNTPKPTVPVPVPKPKLVSKPVKVAVGHSTPSPAPPRPLSHPAVGAATGPKRNTLQALQPPAKIPLSPASLPNDSGTTYKTVLGNGLPALPLHPTILKAATSKTPPILKNTPFQSELGSTKDSENLAALNSMFERLSFIAAAASTANRDE